MTRKTIYAVATQQGGAEITTNDICPTVTAAAGMSGNNQPWICMENRNEEGEYMDIRNAEVRQLQGEQDGINDERETVQVGDGYSGYVARRLTPTECARLQGFPPDWCADVEHSDSAEYKLWGNGISLPCIIPMMKAMGGIINAENNN